MNVCTDTHTHLWKMINIMWQLYQARNIHTHEHTEACISEMPTCRTWTWGIHTLIQVYIRTKQAYLHIYIYIYIYICCTEVITVAWHITLWHKKHTCPVALTYTNTLILVQALRIMQHVRMENLVMVITIGSSKSQHRVSTRHGQSSKLWLQHDYLCVQTRLTTYVHINTHANISSSCLR